VGGRFNAFHFEQRAPNKKTPGGEFIAAGRSETF
jgi:hypothetical protein